ncbi:hypothetical protein MOQ72_27605 [Saccharopolyspora sp. K220]|uniref:hypothetical protein n=1 Tax=Saccharopolyspora soli TaxID=2926618 RepID=UPI001F583BD6|nr:hypothetical protein [Saccharopolyspora soli]MCI2421214.1 hypothetical protein [Saccharopolyspora soli]
MAPPPPDPGGSGPSWPTSGKELKADPSSLRGYGENVATIGKNLESDAMGPAMLVNGGGDDISISTGGFPEGTRAQTLVGRNGQEMMMFLQAVRQNHLAISSAAHTCADMYEGTDGSNAVRLAGVEWAFALPGAQRPAEAPAYLKETLADGLKNAGGPGPVGAEKLVETNHFSGGVAYKYEAPDGSVRTVVRTPEGITETGYNSQGAQVYTTTAQPGGTMITTTYNEKTGKVVNTSTRTVTNVPQGGGTVDEVTTVTNRDAEGRETRTEDHKVTTQYSDGTHTRQYYTEDEQGNRSGERYIGRQPEPVTPEDWAAEVEQNMARNRQMVGG